jgi:hypothetical protein
LSASSENFRRQQQREQQQQQYLVLSVFQGWRSDAVVEGGFRRRCCCCSGGGRISGVKAPAQLLGCGSDLDGRAVPRGKMDSFASSRPYPDISLHGSTNIVGWEMSGRRAPYKTRHPSCGSRGRKVCKALRPCHGIAETHIRAPPERQVHLKTPERFEAHTTNVARVMLPFSLARGGTFATDPSSGCFAAAPTSRWGRHGGGNSRRSHGQKDRKMEASSPKTQLVYESDELPEDLASASRSLVRALESAPHGSKWRGCTWTSDGPFEPKRTAPGSSIPT